jgi:hypothetical protein
MKIRNFRLPVYLFCLLIAFGGALDSRADTVTYQGLLSNSSGGLQLGSFDFTFRLYAAPLDGEFLWQEVHPGVITDEGRFRVELGTFDPEGLATAIRSEAELWLGISVDAGTEMLPRHRLAATPRALRAGYADGLAPGAITGEMIVGSSITLDKLESFCQPGDILVMGIDGWECGSEPACFPEPEICDGLDNDCDGATDESLATPACDNQQGVCAGSVRTCGGVSGWSACGTADYGPNYQTLEEGACDKLDNDCNGTVDDLWLDPFGRYVSDENCGSCGYSCVGRLPNATSTCSITDSFPVCVISECHPGQFDLNGNPGDGCECIATEEICDGLDNNCNGLVDEGFPSLGESCSAGIGSCQRFGVLMCEQGGSTPQCSVIPGTAVTETCNSIDDDCNGQVDETFPTLGGSCAEGIGACQRIGVVRCSAIDDTQTECSVIGGSGEQEICDGLDNDCDDQTDEDLSPVSCSMQAGVCAGSTRQCGGTAGFLECGKTEYGLDFEFTELSCDGKDNNCDGEYDEKFGLGESCGFGVCAGGVVICSNDGGVTCSTKPLATPETCNGEDDDCDGIVDEGCPVEGDIVITEIMPNPASVDDNAGEWFELKNVSGNSASLTGCSIHDDSMTHNIVGPLTVGAGEFLLFAVNGKVNTNGGLIVDYVYTGFAFANPGDSLTLKCGFSDIDKVDFDSITYPYAPGVSMQLDPVFEDHLDNNDVANWCAGVARYGDGDFGSPGEQNGACP